MSYATLDDMITRFGQTELIQLTDKEGLGAIDQAAFEQAQVDGDGEIEGYLIGSYQLPLANVPTILIRIACDLYRYYLYGSLVPEHIENRYKRAIDLLKLINKGDINLNPDRQGETVQESGRDVHVVSAPSFINEKSLRNF